EAGFFMIHNAWTIAIGNRHDMAQTADMLEKFDISMKKLYADRTGMDEKQIAKMMDAESWIAGADAVEQGFASAIMGEDDIEEDDESTAGETKALRKMDIALAKAGMPRTERRA